MPLVTLSPHAYAAVLALGHGRLELTRPNADGTYDVILAETTIARLHEMAFPAESLSDTVLRVCSLANGRAMN